jgi:hypothetical protein
MVELIEYLFFDHIHLNDLMLTNEVKIVLLHTEYNILHLKKTRSTITVLKRDRTFKLSGYRNNSRLNPRFVQVSIL